MADMTPILHEEFLVKGKNLISAVILFGAPAVMGGISRVLLGVDGNSDMKGEIIRHAFIALPIGVCAGWAADAYFTVEAFPYAAAFAAGTVAANIARAWALKGSDFVIKAIIDQLSRGKK